jgi:hypothetical protein
MLSLRKSIPDRSIFLYLAIFAAITASIFGGLIYIGSAYPSFHDDLTSELSRTQPTDTTTFPARKIDTLPVELKHDTLRLVAKDGVGVEEITVVLVDGPFDLKQEPKATLTPPQRNVLHDP